MAPQPRLSPYDPRSPSLFRAEALRVAAAIETTRAVEHIGSTAVPGLAGKPTIDMAVGVPTLELEAADFSRMEALGYAYGGDHGLRQHVFRKGERVPWKYLVHVVDHDGAMWRDYLRFRDHLRTHAEDARAYAALKASLLAGRDSWYSGRDKEAFIAPILARVDTAYGRPNPSQRSCARHTRSPVSLPFVARDDWRIRIELEEESGAESLLSRLGLDLGSEAREVARELEERRLAVSRDGEHVYVYAASGLEAEQASAVVAAVLREEDVRPRDVHIEHWLAEEDRWESHPADRQPIAETGPSDDRATDDAPPTIEEDLLARGYAPWEVRVECQSLDEAERLAGELEREGYGVVRHFRYVIAGTATREEAAALARRVHGEVEPGGELVWEVTPQNPFAIFGGLGG